MDRLACRSSKGTWRVLIVYPGDMDRLACRSCMQTSCVITVDPGDMGRLACRSCREPWRDINVDLGDMDRFASCPRRDGCDDVKAWRCSRARARARGWRRAGAPCRAHDGATRHCGVGLHRAIHRRHRVAFLHRIARPRSIALGGCSLIPCVHILEAVRVRACIDKGADAQGSSGVWLGCRVRRDQARVRRERLAVHPLAHGASLQEPVTPVSCASSASVDGASSICESASDEPSSPPGGMQQTPASPQSPSMVPRGQTSEIAMPGIAWQTPPRSAHAGTGRTQQTPPPLSQLVEGSSRRLVGQVPPSEVHWPRRPHGRTSIGPHEATPPPEHPPPPPSQSHACALTSRGTMSRRLHRHRMPSTPAAAVPARRLVLRTKSSALFRAQARTTRDSAIMGRPGCHQREPGPLRSSRVEVRIRVGFVGPEPPPAMSCSSVGSKSGSARLSLHPSLEGRVPRRRRPAWPRRRWVRDGRWSGRRDSNPRRPPWQEEKRRFWP
jgi:hypothetical protein